MGPMLPNCDVKLLRNGTDTDAIDTYTDIETDTDSDIYNDSAIDSHKLILIMMLIVIYRIG